MRIVSTLVLAAAACCGSPRAPTPAARPPGDASVADVQRKAVDLTQRARAHVDQLVASLRADTADSHDGLRAQFAPGAVVLWPKANAIEGAIFNLREAALAEGSHDEVTGVTVANLTSGGGERAMWVSAELQIAQRTGTGEALTQTVRVSELVGADGKILAAAFGRVRMPETGSKSADVAAPTEAGPLTALALDPAGAAKTLRDDQPIAVFGLPSTRATDVASARALLATLAAMGTWTLQGPPHEIRSADAGFVQAHLDLKMPAEDKPRRVAVQLIAMPDGAGGWRVASVHYLPLR